MGKPDELPIPGVRSISPIVIGPKYGVNRAFIYLQWSLVVITHYWAGD